jgi:hypothetical protein
MIREGSRNDVALDERGRIGSGIYAIVLGSDQVSDNFFLDISFSHRLACGAHGVNDACTLSTALTLKYFCGGVLSTPFTVFGISAG